MPGSNNFLVFNANKQNIQDDTTYNSDSQRLNGVAPGIAVTELHNKLYYQVSMMCAALGQVIANAGNTASDSDINTLISVITSTFANATTLANYISAFTPCTDASTAANTFILTPVSPGSAPTAYAINQKYWFKAKYANTGACTGTVAGLTAKSIKKSVSQDLVSGDILAGQICLVVYDGTNLQLLNPDMTAQLSAAAGANVETAQSILTKLLTVDGSGSGLDADMLRGVTPGNAVNQIPLNNGTINTNLNAQKLNGKTAASTPGTTEQTDIIGMINEILSSFNTHNSDVIKHIDYTSASGTNAYTATDTSITSYSEGMSVKVKFTNANTGASTLNLNSLGAVAIQKGNGNALSSGNIKAGQVCHLVYTVINSVPVFQLLGEGGEYGTATGGEVLSGYTVGTDGGVMLGTLALTGTAVASDVNSGKTFYNTAAKTKVTGTAILDTLTTFTAGDSIAIFHITGGYDNSRYGTTHMVYTQKTINRSGTIRVAFSLGIGAGVGYATVYQNGTSVSPVYSCSKTTLETLCTIDLTVSVNDVIRIDMWNSQNSVVYLANVRFTIGNANPFVS